MGTSSGHLCLWDLRYGLLVRQWQVSQTAIQVIAGHPVRGKGKWVIVASEIQYPNRNEVDVSTLMVSIDLSNGEIVERFQTTASSSSSTSAGSETEKTHQAYLDSSSALGTPAQAVEALLASRERIDLGFLDKPADTQYGSASSVRAIHTMEAPPGDTGFGSKELSPVHESFDSSHGQEKGPPLPGGLILSVSQDRIVRLWNLGQPTQSLVVSGAGKDSSKRYRYAATILSCAIKRVG